MIRDFLEKNEVIELDDKRQISNEEKISAYTANPSCSMCKKTFKDYKEPEYHHVDRYADGGVTKLSNIMVLCGDCHNKIHGKGNLVLPDESEKIEEDV